MMISDAEAPPSHTVLHDALSVFVGDWRAEGHSYGSPSQPKDRPKSRPETWTSAHNARWHTGGFFLVQSEHAYVGGSPFDTLSVLGVDVETGKGFARTFENHGFERRYALAREGNVWTFVGEHERARHEFSADGHRQTIVWEWKPEDRWLPLCDRVAVKVS